MSIQEYLERFKDAKVYIINAISSFSISMSITSMSCISTSMSNWELFLLLIGWWISTSVRPFLLNDSPVSCIALALRFIVLVLELVVIVVVVEIDFACAIDFVCVGFICGDFVGTAGFVGTSDFVGTNDFIGADGFVGVDDFVGGIGFVAVAGSAGFTDFAEYNLAAFA